MDLVLRFMSEVKFVYSVEMPDPITVSSLLEKQKVDKVRADWIKTARALVQTRMQTLEVRVAWLHLSNQYLVLDRVSMFADPTQTSRLMLHKPAAEHYERGYRELSDALFRARNGRLFACYQTGAALMSAINKFGED